MDEFQQQITKLLEEAVAKAKQDHAGNLPPDASDLLQPIKLQSVNEAEVNEVIKQLSQMASTKNGLSRVLTLLNLVVKYAAKL